MSKIEVNKVGPQCGTTVTVGCGAGQTVNVDAATVTLGRCGGSVALASGATQSGFGRSGSVNWQTTPKTTTFTAVNGEGYFINSGSAITMNLPAGSAGAIVAVADYARNFSTYNLTISPNGSEKIGGVAASSALTVDGQAATFVYVDSTKGWVNVQNAEDTETGATYISATGGTILTACTNFKVHVFTGPGTFCVSQVATSPTNNNVDYMIVAGGGGGGGGSGPGTPSGGGGGGGAGGFRESPGTATGSYTVSPLGSPGPNNAPVTVSVQGYPIVVGSGQPGGTQSAKGTNGNPSSGLGITSAGGGGGAFYTPPSSNHTGLAGGSGGGGAGPSSSSGGSGNTPSVSPPQGQNGGGSASSSPTYAGNAGGGAGAVGGNLSPTEGGAGGSGVGTAITTSSCYGTPGPSGSLRYYAGGGGGGSGGSGGTANTGGTGGGGAGGYRGQNGPNGAANTGGGAGGAGQSCHTGGTGGSGIVMIRYRFQT